MNFNVSVSGYKVTLVVRGHVVAAGRLLCARRLLLHVKKLLFKNEHLLRPVCVGVDMALK